jgi:phospholipid/cholesterol/gamma-HCH transport system permease protein
VLDGTAGNPVLRLDGVWDLSGLEALDAQLARIGLASDPTASPDSGASRGGPSGESRLLARTVAGDAVLTLDGRRLAGIDTAAAALIVSHLAAIGVLPGSIRLERFNDSHRRVFEVVIDRLPSPAGSGVLPDAGRGPLTRLGAACIGFGRLIAGHLGFFGLVIVELTSLLRHPGSLRGRELAAQFAQVCIGAIPVTLLVTFLIGTIMAYLLGQQAEQYGASIFVVDGVALGVVREFSPLIVATIVAGRSGAAFTAQLGTMRLTEEIDAIRTLGLSPEQVLVVPRVLALVVSLPLLVFAGDVAGFAGAMLVSDVMLGLTPQTFLERVEIALDARHYLIGLAKAPVFALWIAVIGCRMGLAVSRDTRSIGINTTSTVVQSIVAVILLDAAFAVLLQELGL